MIFKFHKHIADSKDHDAIRDMVFDMTEQVMAVCDDCPDCATELLRRINAVVDMREGRYVQTEQH